MAFRAFLDANVLYSATLRGLLLNLASDGFFVPLWSERCLDEVAKNLHLEKSVYGATFDRQRGYLIEHFPNSVVWGFERIELADDTAVHPNDVHILQAAIAGSAGALVTFNLRDFPPNLFDEFGIELVHPDQFLQDLFDLDSQLAANSVWRQVLQFENPPVSLADFAQSVRNAGCPVFADLILGEHSI